LVSYLSAKNERGDIILTYKSLYSQVDEQINKRLRYRGTEKYDSQLKRSQSLSDPFMMAGSGRRDLSAQELIAAMQAVLNEALPDNIVEGLEVTATNPISNQITISAGKGSAGGVVYELSADITTTVPFDSVTQIYYVNLHTNRILFDKKKDFNKLNIAKIIVPNPGTTNRVKDKREDDYPWDAYIVNMHKYYLYGINDQLEEDSIDLLRDNMGDILADNIVGNLRLSENLTISNTAGTLELNSVEMLIKDFDGDVMARFNQYGIYFNRADGVELAKFTTDGARIGNIVINVDSLQSDNYVTGSTGFKIQDNGDVEFNNMEVRGTVYATAGEIGGWTIESDNLYATTTGTIKTGANVGAGYNGVILDYDGLRVYDSVLGCVVNFPSDGSAPTISSGTITEVIYEISTNSVIRTSATVGDGSADSSGILINNTGVYGCEANQILADANFKVLANGSAYFKGQIQATSGTIGGVTISGDTLVGGTIIGAVIRGSVMETSDVLPKIRIDENGIYYQVTTNVGKYDQFKYGDGTYYGTGVLAYLFNEDYALLSIQAEYDKADIGLYNRNADPGIGTGPHRIGDLICVSGILKMCSIAGSPGTFVNAATLGATFTGLSDTPANYTASANKWLRVNGTPDAVVFDTINMNDLEQTSLADPGADRIVFWDDTDTQFEFLVPNTGLTISGNNLNNDVAIETCCITLPAEYPGAVLYADGANNNVVITSGHDNSNHENYYNLTADATNDYDIVIQVRVPDAFSSWLSSGQKIRIWGDDKTNSSMTFAVYDTAGNLDGTDTITQSADSTWETKTIADATFGGTYTAGSCFHIHLKGTIGSNGDNIRFGWIELKYTRGAI